MVNTKIRQIKIIENIENCVYLKIINGRRVKSRWANRRRGAHSLASS